MGSPNSETRRWGDEGPQRTVRFSNFVISKYEVTRAQWNKVMGINLQYYTGNNKPIENISWDDVQEFCKRLNLMLGLSGDDAYRLPSEAEWEYAARARTTTPFAFGMTIDTAIVNYYGSGPYGMALK